jgi:uncharacterized membrane protein
LEQYARWSKHCSGATVIGSTVVLGSTIMLLVVTVSAATVTVTVVGTVVVITTPVITTLFTGLFTFTGLFMLSLFKMFKVSRNEPNKDWVVGVGWACATCVTFCCSISEDWVVSSCIEVVAFVLASKIALRVDGSSSVMLTGGRSVGNSASV